MNSKGYIEDYNYRRANTKNKSYATTAKFPVLKWPNANNSEVKILENSITNIENSITDKNNSITDISPFTAYTSKITKLKMFCISFLFIIFVNYSIT